MKTNKLKNLLVDVILHSIFYKYMSIKMIFTNFNCCKETERERKKYKIKGMYLNRCFDVDDFIDFISDRR